MLKKIMIVVAAAALVSPLPQTGASARSDRHWNDSSPGSHVRAWNGEERPASEYWLYYGEEAYQDCYGRHGRRIAVCD